jgi:hypothetical protein
VKGYTLNRVGGYFRWGALFFKSGSYIATVTGLLFILSAFTSLGPYHFVGEENITGFLWNFMVPTWWSAMFVGVILLNHGRLRIENRRLAFFTFGASLIIILLRFQDVDYFLGLWHGVRRVFDVEFRGDFIPFAVSLVGLFASFLMMDCGCMDGFQLR